MSEQLSEVDRLGGMKRSPRKLCPLCQNERPRAAIVRVELRRSHPNGRGRRVHRRQATVDLRRLRCRRVAANPEAAAAVSGWINPHNDAHIWGVWQHNGPYWEIRYCLDCDATEDRETTMDDSDMQVSLRMVDADALLACVEWAINRPDLDLGPGLHRSTVEAAARRVESVADMARRGFRST